MTRTTGTLTAFALCLCLSLAPGFEASEQNQGETQESEESSRPERAWAAFKSDLRDDGLYLLKLPTRRTRKGLWTTAGVLGGVGLLIAFDEDIRDHVQERRSQSQRIVANRFSSFGEISVDVLAVGLVFAVGKHRDQDRLTETGRAMSEALVFSQLFTSAFKITLGREGPRDGDADDFFDYGSNRFPSGHASRAFALATVIARRHGKKAAWVAYPLATLVGLSRIVEDEHWASDVFAGAALGYFVGRAVVRLRSEREGQRGRIAYSPIFTPERDAVGVTLRISY